MEAKLSSSTIAAKSSRGTHLISSRRMRESITGWLWASPWILGFLIFTLGPMLTSLYYSFTDYGLLSPPQWIGLGNYRTMIMDDPLTLQGLKVTTVYGVVSVPMSLVLGLVIAILLNQEIVAMPYWRTLYYLPSVVAGVAVAMMWSWIFNSDFGVANWLLGMVGIKGPNWFTDPHWALPAIIIMNVWGFGGSMIIYLAGLQSIPSVLYEAALIDGAGAWHRFRHVTIPMLSPTVFFTLIMGLIGALQTFTPAYIMTNGGPRNATLFFMLHLYRNAFQWLKMGYASALAWVLFVYILILTLLVVRSSPAWVHYEGEARKK